MRLTNSRNPLTCCFLVFHLISSVFFTLTECGSTQLNSANFDALIATHEVVFLNFYADWCRFSQILGPVFDEAADKLSAKNLEPGKALLGKVDCDSESGLASRFHISKYPTLKLIRQGVVAKREFRGQRSVDALVSFVEEQIKDPVQQIANLSELENVENKKRYISAFFERKDLNSYDVLRRVAMNLREDCEFFIGIGDEFRSKLTQGDAVFFRPAYPKENAVPLQYAGNLTDFNAFNKWATQNCIPMVREITFENAEELTEEGLPFLILFHHPDDHEIIEKYSQVVVTELFSDKANLNFLTADGHKFAHPLQHLGKSVDELPLIAIDSFRHMYLFPDIKQMSEPGKLKQFADDLYSGKLHREFHYGPDPTPQKNEPQPPGQDQPDMNQAQKDAKGPTTPPESTFKKLAPSRNRYTLLRDEL